MKKLIILCLSIIIMSSNVFASQVDFEQQINMNLLSFTKGTIYEVNYKGKNIYYHTNDIVFNNDINNVNNILAKTNLKRKINVKDINIIIPRFSSRLKTINNYPIQYFSCTVKE